MNVFDVQTHAGEQVVNITDALRQAAKEVGITDGAITALTPHTSCGLAMLVGSSLQFIIKGGALQLGPWQSVFLCEFDGPRNRHVWLG